MISYILQVAAAYTVWRLLRLFLGRKVLHNIPGPPSTSFWKGNLFQLLNSYAWEFHTDIAAKYGGVIKINSLFGSKMLYIFDPKAMHHVLIKDQYTYEETSMFIETNKTLFGSGLFSTIGDEHRKQRKMLNPVFSIAHMKAMVPTFNVVGNRLKATLLVRVSKGPQEIDVLQWMSRTALELIGQAGLGHSFDSLTDDSTNPYVELVKNIMPSITRLAVYRHIMLPWALKIGTPRFRRFIVDLLPLQDLHNLRDATNVMHATSVHVYEGKKQALEGGDEDISNQISQGKDVISVLMKANMEAADGEQLSEATIISQMSTLVFAATDTTSGALARILHLLAEHPGAQERLREEVTAARKKAGQDLSYDELVSLPYLDAICSESLRLYPPFPMALRTTRRDVVLPVSKPIQGVDGKEIHEIYIPNDTNVMVSIIGANRNPEIWGSDSLEWKPERWLSPLPDTVVNAHIPGIYANTLSFLGGGRACIGFKFAELEIKVILSLLVDTFRISPPGPEKEIVWRMSSIVSPIVKDGEGKSELPLRLSLVDPPYEAI